MMYRCVKCDAWTDDDENIGTETPDGFICENCAAEVEEMKDKFNKYCAEVIDIKLSLCAAENDIGRSEILVWENSPAVEYNPYDDLNQRMPVFDKLYIQPIMSEDLKYFLRSIHYDGIDKATKDFIISTMEKENGH